ncbi:MAG: DNA adenine methylase [Candidatus Micrarchaeia archaeon]
MPAPNKKYDYCDPIQLNLKNKTREEFRRSIVTCFLLENKGYWDDEVQHVMHYTYFVETIADGSRIYLKRPARLNKGMDFQVNAENFLKYENGNNKPPSHKDIIKDLKNKKKEAPKKFAQLMKLIARVYNCEEPDEVLSGSNLKFNSGATIELLLKLLKWLFIEQDMTYWSYDGREMLKRGIDELA